MSVDRIVKEIAENREATRISTHRLSGVFEHHQIVMSGNDSQKLLLLQKMFGHSTSAQTMDYIGFTSEEIEDAYLSLSLGGRNNYSRFGVLGERTE